MTTAQAVSGADQPMTAIALGQRELKPAQGQHQDRGGEVRAHPWQADLPGQRPAGRRHGFRHGIGTLGEGRAGGKQQGEGEQGKGPEEALQQDHAAGSVCMRAGGYPLPL